MLNVSRSASFQSCLHEHTYRPYTASKDIASSQSIQSIIQQQYGMKIWTDLSTVLSGITRVTDGQTDRQTNRQTEFSSLYRVCISCSAVKTPGFTV